MTLQPAGGLPPIVQVTDAQGVFSFLDVPPGVCTLKAELEGFSSLSYPGIRLTAGRISSIDTRLNPAVEDTITVTAEAPALDERKVGKTETFDLDEGSGGGRRRKRAARPGTVSPSQSDFEAFAELKQGLVGGVKPLPIAIPESGKLLLSRASFPPEKIGVEIEVKGNKEKRGWF